MKILVAPLNWGLGHASRCVPLVHRFLEEEGVPHEYHEAPGIHDMVFWSEHIQHIVRWMFG